MTTADRAITLPFSFNSSGAVSSTSDPKKIWQDRVVLAVMTHLNERVMTPKYGSSIGEAEFLKVTDAKGIIQQAIKTAFTTWLPALTLKDVATTSDPNSNFLVVNVTYAYGTNANNEQVAIKTAILSRSGDTYTEVTSVNNQ
jgi:hypothetical protein